MGEAKQLLMGTEVGCSPGIIIFYITWSLRAKLSLSSHFTYSVAYNILLESDLSVNLSE